MLFETSELRLLLWWKAVSEFLECSVYSCLWAAWCFPMLTNFFSLQGRCLFSSSPKNKWDRATWDTEVTPLKQMGKQVIEPRRESSSLDFCPSSLTHILECLSVTKVIFFLPLPTAWSLLALTPDYLQIFWGFFCGYCKLEEPKSCLLCFSGSTGTGASRTSDSYSSMQRVVRLWSCWSVWFFGETLCIKTCCLSILDLQSKYAVLAVCFF